MENNQLVKKEDEEIILSKRAAWADVGEVIYYAESELKMLSENSISKLIEPQSIEQIQESENILKIVKKEYNLLVEKRKETTDPLSTVASRLMAYEKNLASKLPAFENCIISLKKQKEKNESLQKLIQEERKRVRETCISHINISDINFRKKISSQCEFAFEYALGKGAIKPEDLEEYLKKVNQKFKDEDFTLAKPNIVIASISSTELDIIWNESMVNMPLPSFYIETYLSELKTKFEFYGIAFKNKEEALKASKLQAAEQEAVLNKEAANKQISAQLTSMATSFEAQPTDTVKALKLVYDLDMEESEQSALLIIAAFVSNFQNTKEYIRSSWFNLKVEQMANSLVALKNKDEKFECTGIKFKKIEKL